MAVRYTKSKYEDEYLPHDKYVTLNEDDKDLEPIVLRLSNTPDVRWIEGYGKPVLEQTFPYQEVPEKLKRIEDQALKEEQNYANSHKSYTVTLYKIQKRYWKLVEENKSLLKDEIEWIKNMHWHLEYGYWCYIKGKPTYITPWHFRFLNFWYMKQAPNNRPEYRDVDRRSFMGKYYAYTCTETFAELDEDGVPYKDDSGRYVMKDLGYRLYYGYIKPKRRREGATNQDMCILRILLEKQDYGVCTVVADTGDNARDLFKEVFLPAWDKEPMFLKPVNDSGVNPNSITLTPPAGSFGEKYIGSSIDYTESAQPRANDRRQIIGILLDEAGKTIRGVDERHEVTKLTTSQKYDIRGYMMYPSTVEWMNEGGEVYKRLANQSGFYKRNPTTGQTVSGLFRLFFKGWDGMDGFIDKWGYSVIETPTHEQIAYAPYGAKYLNGKGAKQQLTEELDFLLKSGTPEDLQLYNQRLRKEPKQWSDCWIGVEGEVGFDTVLLSKRMAELERERPWRTGNFIREGGDPDGRVLWVDDVNGKFEVSSFPNSNNQYVLTDEQWNEKYQTFVTHKRPLNPSRYVAGSDPFDYDNKTIAKTRHGVRQSDGGFAVLLNYDTGLDGDKDMQEADTPTFVCSYRSRPGTLHEYMEDVIAACQYFGAMIVIERNKTRIWEHFIDRGYGGYLMYMQKPDGSYHEKPGVYLTGKAGDELFDVTRDYIKFRAHKEKHYSYLKECFEIKGKEDITNKDRFAAHGMALLGARSGYGKAIERVEDVVVDISRLMS